MTMEDYIEEFATEATYLALSKTTFFEKQYKSIRWLWTNLLWIGLVILAFLLFERYYLHRKVTKTNEKIDKVIENQTGHNEGVKNEYNNEKLFQELSQIKKELKNLQKTPSRIKRPPLKKKDDEVKIERKAIKNQEVTDDIFQQTYSKETINKEN